MPNRVTILLESEERGSVKVTLYEYTASQIHKIMDKVAVIGMTGGKTDLRFRSSLTPTYVVDEDSDA